MTWIQAIVDRAGAPLTVVGSAAEGSRRNPGAALPIGKSEGERSDIDYLVANLYRAAFAGLADALPAIDRHGMLTGDFDHREGPGIRFRPDEEPEYLPARVPE